MTRLPPLIGDLPCIVSAEHVDANELASSSRDLMTDINNIYQCCIETVNTHVSGCACEMQAAQQMDAVMCSDLPCILLHGRLLLQPLLLYSNHPR